MADYHVVDWGKSPTSATHRINPFSSLQACGTPMIPGKFPRNTLNMYSPGRHCACRNAERTIWGTALRSMAPGGFIMKWGTGTTSNGKKSSNPKPPPSPSLMPWWDDCWIPGTISLCGKYHCSVMVYHGIATWAKKTTLKNLPSGNGSSPRYPYSFPCPVWRRQGPAVDPNRVS